LTPGEARKIAIWRTTRVVCIFKPSGASQTGASNLC